MQTLTHRDLKYQLDNIETKLDAIALKVTELDKDLAVHKVKTGRLSLVLGGVASLLVAVGASLLKGCV